MKIALLLCFVVACGSEQPKPTAMPSGSSTGTEPAKAPLPEGAACMQPADCASSVCEGQGCGSDHPGHCVASNRMCTQALTTWCGCDGKTFTSSTGCAGQRYAHPNACP